MSEVVQQEEQHGAILDQGVIFEMCDGVEPLSATELAQFAGLITLPQAVAPQAAFDSYIQGRDATYTRPAFTSSVQPTELTFLNTNL